ncbi:MAG: glycosyltransferase [Gemmatimonadota bacterium]
MKKLLVICQTLPFPPDGGSKIRSFNVFKELSEMFEIHLLAFYRRKQGFHQQDIGAAVEGLRPVAHTEAFPIAQEGSTWRWVKDHTLSVLSGRVYTASTFRSAEVLARLRSLLDEQDFHAVHLDSLDLAVYRPEISGVPVTCTHHDAQSLLLARRAEVQGNPLVRSYMRHQSRLMEREERRWCPAMECNFTVSEGDARTLQSLAPDARFEVIPNGVDTDYFSPAPDAAEGIVFVGGTSWYPNRDALEFYSESIRPLLDKVGVEDVTSWVGRIRQEEVTRYQADSRLRLTGYVPDVRPYLAGAACYVVPIRVGGGTRVKILDAWAMGKAVVSTSVGAEGLKAIDGENILIRDEPLQFARAVKEVLSDGSLRRRLGEGARSTAVEEYSWERIGAKIRTIYGAIV